MKFDWSIGGEIVCDEGFSFTVELNGFTHHLMTSTKAFRLTQGDVQKLGIVCTSLPRRMVAREIMRLRREIRQEISERA